MALSPDGRLLAVSGKTSELVRRIVAVLVSGHATLGRLVALKVQSPDILHKTEAGAVALNLAPGEVRAAYKRVLAAAKHYAPEARIEGVLVRARALAPLAFWLWPATTPGPRDWSAVLALGVLCTALAYVLYFRLIQRVGPTGAVPSGWSRFRRL